MSLQKTLEPTCIYGHTSKEGGLWIKYLDLWSIDRKGNTIGWNVRVDGDQGVRARWNSDNAVIGEVLHGKARVLDSLIRICECESGPGREIVVLRTLMSSSVDERAKSLHGGSRKVFGLTLAKYRISQVRSHCASAKTAAEKKYAALNRIDGIILIKTVFEPSSEFPLVQFW